MDDYLGRSSQVHHDFQEPSAVHAWPTANDAVRMIAERFYWPKFKLSSRLSLKVTLWVRGYRPRLLSFCSLARPSSLAYMWCETVEGTGMAPGPVDAGDA